MELLFADIKVVEELIQLGSIFVRDEHDEAVDTFILSLVDNLQLVAELLD